MAEKASWTRLGYSLVLWQYNKIKITGREFTSILIIGIKKLITCFTFKNQSGIRKFFRKFQLTAIQTPKIFQNNNFNNIQIIKLSFDTSLVWRDRIFFISNFKILKHKNIEVYANLVVCFDKKLALQKCTKRLDEIEMTWWQIYKVERNEKQKTNQYSF